MPNPTPNNEQLQRPSPADLTATQPSHSDRVKEQLPSAIDELLAQRVDGMEEAAILEQAHQAINEALNQG